ANVRGEYLLASPKGVGFGDNNLIYLIKKIYQPWVNPSPFPKRRVGFSDFIIFYASPKRREFDNISSFLSSDYSTITTL
ncbi:MAG: hypothetical protein LUG18_07335, partial [Candidatus Azobacteroides sp.]|nr:hypothetical protein [Candidatus Azobacteroides sp.]